MKRGVIGIPTDAGDLPLLDVENDTATARGEHGNELTAVLSVKESRNLSGETKYYLGEGFKDREAEVDHYHFDDGSIRKEALHVEIQQDYGEFVMRPGDDTDHRGFIVTSSSDGEFLFPMIGRQNGVTVQRASLRLGEWVQDHTDLTATTAGGVTPSFQASKMTAWGDKVLDDEDIQVLLGDAIEANVLTQIAGQYVWEDYPFHVTLAASGYAEVYNPSDLTTEEFLRWLCQEVIPYAEEGS